MNFQQLRAVREAARNGYNLTEVAQVLYTSQPGVSRQIRELEDELGVDIFIRAGKRLTGLTPPGEALLLRVKQAVAELRGMDGDMAAWQGQARGQLVIGVLPL